MIVKKNSYLHKHYYAFNSVDSAYKYCHYIIFYYFRNFGGNLYVTSNYKNFSDSNDDNLSNQEINIIIILTIIGFGVVLAIIIAICYLVDKRKSRIINVENEPSRSIIDNNTIYYSNEHILTPNYTPQNEIKGFTNF